MEPSKKRRLLALYVDFLLFTGIYAPTAWLIGRSSGFQLNVITSLLIFAVLREGLTRLLGSSPGRWALGISGRGAPVLNRTIWTRGSWWTMVIGTLLVLEGSKNLVRWTQGLPPPPIFGSAVSDDIGFAAISTLGVLNLLAGLLILRTNPIGAIIGGAVLTLELGVTLVNRAAFHDWVARAVVARRELQGLPVRDGLIEFMQGVASVGMPIILGGGLLCMVAVATRLRRQNTA